MKVRQKKSRGFRAALVLTTMLCAGCARGQTVLIESRADVSSEYLRSLARDYSTGTYGQPSREAIKDWITQNEPSDDGAGN